MFGRVNPSERWCLLSLAVAQPTGELRSGDVAIVAVTMSNVCTVVESEYHAVI